MKKRIDGIICLIMGILIATLSGCGSDEYTTAPSVIEDESVANFEKVREETEAEIAERAKQQVEIAKAKSEAQKVNPDSELVMTGDIGEVSVASSIRPGITIPTYIYFPEDYKSENTYPLVIMLAGFSADHNNGTGFDKITEDLTKKGLIVVQYDNPGYGKSEETNLAYTLTNVKNDALDVLNYVKKNYNIGKVGALGYDVGGRVIMEMQAYSLYNFDCIELIGPYCDTADFVHACFESKNWGGLKAKAKDAGWVKFGEQEYSLQWFEDWEAKESTIMDDFCKAYEKKRIMLVYSTIDDCVNPLTMDKFYKKIGAAAISISDIGHDLGVRGFETTEQTERTVRKQSVDFMSDLKR